jgi:hypothetical protein
MATRGKAQCKPSAGGTAVAPTACSFTALGAADPATPTGTAELTTARYGTMRAARDGGHHDQ